MLQAAVLAFCVFPHNEDVYILVTGYHPWQALTVDDIGIEVKAGTVRVTGKKSSKAQLATNQGHECLNPRIAHPGLH